MNTKFLLKFYFKAGRAEDVIDRLIEAEACSRESMLRGGAQSAEKIIKLVECKDELAALWAYLDAVISGFGETAGALRDYAEGKYTDKKLVNRTVMRFRRRARRIDRFSREIATAERFAAFCL